jgi:hypothetical protein
MTALSNVAKVVDRNRRFPANVFVGIWSEFWFFDSDRIFDEGFIGEIKSLLDIEGAACACLLNLDRATHQDAAEARFFVGAETNPEDYRVTLVGARPGSGWVHNVDRFAGTSDGSQWGIYCERASEIAVVALRSGIPTTSYIPVIKKLEAAPIDEAIRAPLSYGFSASALSSQWRHELLRQYPRSSY